MNLKTILLIGAVTVCMQACVPQKKLEDAQANIAKLNDENAGLQKQVNDLTSQNASLARNINDLNDQVKALIDDTTAQAARYRELDQLYDQTVQQNKLLLSTSSSEKLALNDSLKKKQTELNRKGHALDSLQRDLMDREAKVKELQSLLSQKDSATEALRKAISQALLGFEKSDLTVEQRGGKVYVSMAEKLLFKSGSTTVDPKGSDALQKLAAVLKKNPDINVMIEGHTDNVPLNGTGAMKDNWDLSVLRATSISRILIQNGVDPKQITSSGRGEYFPIASNDTPEGRAKNRRTEIILSPKLNELMKILGN